MCAMDRRLPGIRERKCPKCGVAMKERKVARFVIVDVCPKCEGIWFDHGELKEVLHAPITERADPRTLLPANRTTLPCPDCHWPLYRRPFGSRSHVDVHQCIQCAGLFFDNGDVDRVVRHLKSRGVKAKEDWQTPEPEVAEPDAGPPRRTGAVGDAGRQTGEEA